MFTDEKRFLDLFERLVMALEKDTVIHERQLFLSEDTAKTLEDVARAQQGMANNMGHSNGH